ncbi:low-specificity L-threonine aldolase [Clostridium sp. Cult2]|uniref:low-specificity L-threonine aldolase n=1 Tax=Clostridium sp. Cult2 TaxID=2079003 RepID=UPI001EFF88FC|nr:low-specificity L-threonine aldolase [Clostridium sp. Cult2]MCF6464390.1 low-specificity L-threonine aldolase [Clostridium sp. Cult2]
MKYIDLRSDTVTQPTEEMRQAMFEAELGDDVYGDDPTINRLEELAAEMVGKEATLFVTSGTMGNQVAIMTHTQLGDEIILGANSHIVQHEVGAAARLSGVSYSIVNNPDNRIYRKDVLERIRGEDIHNPNTGLLCMENALADGTVVSLEEMKDVYEVAHEKNIPVHLDGARLFNAATYLKVEAKEIAQYADSVTFCISKGLCSPVGSLLCGSKEFIKKARKMRKLLGGGMRQGGVLAACGIVSLEKMVNRLEEDHNNAKYLATKLNEIEGFFIDMDKVQINMVFCQIGIEDFNSHEFVQALLKKGIKVNDDGNTIRFVTNNDVNREDIDYVIKCIKEYVTKN